MIKKNRSILYISLTVLFIVCIVCYFGIIKLNNNHKIKESKLKSGMIVTFNASQHISIKNILPMSDELGVRLNNKSVERGGYGFIKFSVKNKNNKKSKYKIYIMKTDSDSYEIDDKYIRFYLTDGDNNTIDGYDPENINSYTDLIALSSKPLGRLIYNGELESEEEKTFILRAWLSDEYMLKDEEEFFDFDIFVESK